jgi:tetratricopeptide (TPR) repeat protein
MNATDYCFILNKPNSIGEKNSLLIDKIVYEFPYFQSARSLQLKIFYNQDSFRYNEALKKTAAHTTDRSVLFDFITTQNFPRFQAKYLKEKTELINDIIVNSIEILDHSNASKLEKSIVTAAFATTNEILHPRTVTIIEERLEIGKPFHFDRSEKHSFQEWLQLSNHKPINRIENTVNIDSDNEFLSEKKSQLDIIDKFIETNPKISPINKDNTILLVSNQNSLDNSMLMTETLAKVYLEQKKYTKAIQAYEILILKYPEKSSFFADRISDIKTMQQNNN